MMNKFDDLGLPKDQEPVLRVTTRPNDANPNGDIFGGWLMSEIDIAGAIVAGKRDNGPVVTVAVKELLFIKPLFVYDLVTFYAEITATGKTSVTIHVEVYAQRERGSHGGKAVKVSDAILVYVAVSEPGKPRALPK
jgi:acyl-CoA thioesterase YciA